MPPPPGEAYGGHRSGSRRVVELQVFGKEEKIEIPCLVVTKVQEMKEMLAERLGVSANSLEFFYKQGAYLKKQWFDDEIQVKTLVKGIKSFGSVRTGYEYPHIIVGAGLGGLRMALCFIQGGQQNFAVFESNERLGGSSWLKVANETSRLQTEIGTYHLSYSDKSAVPKGMSVWPSRDDLLRHFTEVADNEGISPYISFRIEVQKHTIIKDEREEDTQNYKLSLKSTAGEASEFMAASLLSFGGGMGNPRDLEFRGEESFGGPISLGRSSDFTVQQVEGKSVAIVGFGSFALENVRSCCEFKAKKIYLICRKKNLTLPRMVSWEVNGAIHPISAAMLLKHMQPAYSLLGEDPWQYPSVDGNASQTSADINQTTRFAVSDAYFLATYFGALECKVGQVKRLTKNTVHLDNGVQIDDVCAVLKCVGFEPSFACDKLLQAREMHGFWVNGDYRLAHWAEFPSITPNKLAWTSHGPPLFQTCEMLAHMLDFPTDFRKLVATGQLPVHKSDMSRDIPCCCIDAKLGNAIITFICATVPVLTQRAQFHSQFKRQRQWETHSVKEVIDEASAEWQKYSKMFKEQHGYDKPIPEYPYTVQSMWGLIDENDTEGEQG